jgi:nitroreductase
MGEWHKSKFTDLQHGFMDVFDALEGRRSIRAYQDRPVSRETVEKLLQAAELAPSAGNLQSRRYVVVMCQDLRKALALAAYGQSHISSAPVDIVVCADVRRSSRRYGDRGSLYAIQDADAAVMCMLLAAHAMGLGACWNGAFDEEMVRDILSIEEGVAPVAIISLGWPAESPRSPGRLPPNARWEV